MDYEAKDRLSKFFYKFVTISFSYSKNHQNNYIWDSSQSFKIQLIFFMIPIPFGILGYKLSMLTTYILLNYEDWGTKSNLLNYNYDSDPNANIHTIKFSKILIHVGVY